MSDFPTLSMKPSPGGFTEGYPQDPTIRSNMESGRQITRARFTKAARQWEFTYELMTTADVNALRAFQESVGFGGGEFNWVHPTTAETHIVRFAAPIKIQSESNNSGLWQISVKLIERL